MAETENKGGCLRLYQVLTEMIPVGREQAIHLRELAAVLGLPERVVQRLILGARLHGCLILSGDAGYYRAAAGQHETADYVRRRAAAIGTSVQALAVFRQAAEDEKGEGKQ